MAFIAYHFHWEFESIVNLEHADRQLFVEQISHLNERANSESARG